MSKFIIELEDNGAGVLIKAHAQHTTEQMQSGQTVTLATQIGGYLVETLEQKLLTIRSADVAQPQTQH